MSWTGIKQYFSEIVIISSFVSYIVLVLTDFSGIISRVLDGSQPLTYLLNIEMWLMFGLAALKNFVWLLIGIFTKALKNIFAKSSENDKNEIAALSKAVTMYQIECIQSKDPHLVEVARTQALALIGSGVDLYNTADTAATSIKKEAATTVPQAASPPK